MSIMSREFCPFLEGGLANFAFWVSLKVVMAVFPQNTIFLGYPVVGRDPVKSFCSLVPGTLSLAVILEVRGEEAQPLLIGEITDFVCLIPGFEFIGSLCHTINCVKRSFYFRYGSMLSWT